MPFETQKDIKIGFFTESVAEDSELSFGGFLKHHAEANNNATAPLWIEGRHSFEVRGIEEQADGNMIHGVFAKFRTDQIPHAGQAGGVERELDLGRDEGLIEKNHFIYRKSDSLLIYEQNGHGSRPAKLAKYVTSLVGETLTFDPVLQHDAVERLMRGNAHVRSMRVSFARPTNPEMYPDDDWSRGLLENLSQVGGSSVALMITTDSRSDDEEKRALADRIKDSAAAFMRSGYARSVRVNVEEDGVEHPIDLMADRIVSPQSVAMAGKYPLKESIYAALNSAFEDERDTIYEVIGLPGHRLD